MSDHMPAIGNAVTLREVYGLINSTKAELMAEIQKVSAHVDAQLTKHETDHTMHDRLHEKEHDKRSSLIRWAVTTILAGIGVAAAIIIPIIMH